MRPADSGPFPYGVASFEPTTSGILLWTRTASSHRPTWELATDPEFAEVVAHGEVAPAPRPNGERADEADHDAADHDEADSHEASRMVEVEGLDPGQTYYYRFVAEGVTSPTGRTRTLPERDHLRLGLVCCGDYSAGHFGVYRALAEADVDVVVHLGDYVYADPEGDLRRTEPPGDAVDRADYCARYRQVRRDGDLQALHQAHPMLAVIDDHDLTDNAHEHGAPNHDPETQGSWTERRNAAVAERHQWVPIRREGPPDRGPRAEWRSVEMGALGELILLDTRLGGRSEPADEDDGPGLDDLERTMLGRDQVRWAVGRIVDGTGPWSIVVSSVVMNPMELSMSGVGLSVNGLLPDGYLIADGKAINTDAWDGYPADRAELTDAMARRGTGVVVLSGDVHSSWAWEGPQRDGHPVAVEFTCPAATSSPMGEVIPLVGKVVDAMTTAKHGVRWSDLFGHGFVTVAITPDAVTATWWLCDPEDPDARAEVSQSWVTRLAEPGRLVEPEAGEEDHLSPAAHADDEFVELPPRPATVYQSGPRFPALRRMALAGAATAVILWVQQWWRRRRCSPPGNRSGLVP